MTKKMLIDALHPEETRVVIADENRVYDFDFVSATKKQLKGNIYLAKITRVEPSLQAAFVEYGGGKQGFLPFSEIHADYYQIPMSDRKRLMEQVEADSHAPEPEEKPESIRQDETYGEAAILPEASPEAQEQTPGPESESAHPAYLTQGPIEISSEEIEAPDEMIASGTSHEEPEIKHEEIPAITESQVQEFVTEAATSHEPAQPSESTPKTEGVETLPSEDEEQRPKRQQFFKRYRIQEVIRRGQIVLVQVIKEERGNKGVSLTTYLSLPGRYCVLMPNSPKDGGISRKISSADDRKRLKAITTELKLADDMSVIIRTAGMDRTRAEIKRDYDYLVKLWNRIREDTLNSNAPALIYEESDIIKRAIRDQYSSDIDEVIIEGDEGYKAAKEFMKLLLPSHTPKIKHYKEATPLLYAYDVEEQLLSMHDPVVKLRSGGYIVINPTEALISIDVNSGRATGERNIEETAAKTNLEAAAEVARQLRLRDLAGLIVIDFIDMLESRNRRAVEKALKDSLKADRAKIQLGRISPFGLLEMSRQRMRPSISETNMVQCPHCIGRGVIRSNESMSIQIIRSIEKEASSGSWSSLRLIAPQHTALHLLNAKRDLIRAIEQRYNLTIQVTIDLAMTASEFNLEKIRRANAQQQPRQQQPRGRANFAPAHSDGAAPAEGDNVVAFSQPSEIREEGAGENRNRTRGRRGRRGGRGRSERPEHVPVDADAGNIQTVTSDNDSGPAEITSPSDRPERGDRPPRNRGRGRRPWRGDDREPKENRTAEPRKDWEPRPVPAATDGNTLPAFATEAPPPVPLPPKPAAIVPPSTPRDPNAPVRKGWWQKMIELDE